MYSTKLYNFLALFSLLFVGGMWQTANAQCDMEITSVTPGSTVCTGSPVSFTGRGLGIATEFNFNTGAFPPGWSASAYTIGQPCLEPSIDGTDYFWLNGSGLGVPRFVQTSAVDVSAGGLLRFDMDMASFDAVNAAVADCEGPDAGENIFLQYSTDGGTTWLPIIDYSPAAVGGTWASYSVPIPVGAQTVSTMFRWEQLSFSLATGDNWGLDNIQVYQEIPGTGHSWDFGDGNTSTAGASVSHTYTTPGTYLVTYTTTVATILGSCTNTSATTTITVVNPTITAPADLTNVPSTIPCVGASLGSVALGTPTTTSPCAIVSSTNDAPDPLPFGTTTVTWTATFPGGVTATATQDVTVVDGSAPVISGCPVGPINVSTAAGAVTCEAAATWVEPTATDCGVPATMARTHAPGDLFPEGTTTVTYTFTDASSNASTCSFDVVVTDGTNPVLAGCPRIFQSIMTRVLVAL